MVFALFNSGKEVRVKVPACQKLKLALGREASKSEEFFTTNFNPGRQEFMTVRKAETKKKMVVVEEYFDLKPCRPRAKRGKKRVPKKQVCLDA